MMDRRGDESANGRSTETFAIGNCHFRWTNALPAKITPHPVTYIPSTPRIQFPLSNKITLGSKRRGSDESSTRQNPISISFHNFSNFSSRDHLPTFFSDVLQKEENEVRGEWILGESSSTKEAVQRDTELPIKSHSPAANFGERGTRDVTLSPPLDLDGGHVVETEAEREQCDVTIERRG